MDGETEGDTVVIAGQPEVLSTQAMQVIYSVIIHYRNSINSKVFFHVTCTILYNVESFGGDYFLIVVD